MAALVLRRQEPGLTGLQGRCSFTGPVAAFGLAASLSKNSPDVSAWQKGQPAIDLLIGKERLEHVVGDSRTQDANRLIRDASRRLGSADTLL